MRFYLIVLWDSKFFHVAHAQPQYGEDVVLAAPVVEVEAAQVESANLQGPIQRKMISIVTRSTFPHGQRVLSILPSTVK